MVVGPQSHPNLSSLISQIPYFPLTTEKAVRVLHCTLLPLIVMPEAFWRELEGYRRGDGSPMEIWSGECGLADSVNTYSSRLFVSVPYCRGNMVQAIFG